MNFLWCWARETMNPRNNSRMFWATIGFCIFCVAMSFVQVAFAAPCRPPQPGEYTFNYYGTEDFAAYDAVAAALLRGKLNSVQQASSVVDMVIEKRAQVFYVDFTIGAVHEASAEERALFTTLLASALEGATSYGAGPSGNSRQLAQLAQQIHATALAAALARRLAVGVCLP